MAVAEVTIRSNGEGERRWFCGGGLHTWKATEEETGGAFLMFEDDLDAGKVTPLHRHPDVNETFYMLEGEILLHVEGDEPRPVLAGGIAIIPRGIPHAFMVTSERARSCAYKPLARASPSTGRQVSHSSLVDHLHRLTSAASAKQLWRRAPSSSWVRRRSKTRFTSVGVTVG